MSRPPGEFSAAAALDASHQRRGAGAGRARGGAGAPSCAPGAGPPPLSLVPQLCPVPNSAPTFALFVPTRPVPQTQPNFPAWVLDSEASPFFQGSFSLEG